MAQQDKISILGPREDGTYVVEFRTAAGERLAISYISAEYQSYSSAEALPGSDSRASHTDPGWGRRYWGT